jgi:superfamily II DNA helicase RecQ
MVEAVKRQQSGSTIVYAQTRKDVESIATHLQGVLPVTVVMYV